MKKFQWQIPYFVGIFVGAVLWAANGFDVADIIAQWGLIAVMMALYFLIMRGITVEETAS